MIGRTLSHYTILEKLGSGGMGDVYVAEDTELSRKVALKVLPMEMAESEERRARFKREAKAIASLNHPNIVHVYSVEEAEGVHFITMELVSGKTLSELIPKHGMPLGKFFEVAVPLADAVSAAHENGVIHRDLKPDNLMLDEEGRLKILDFGLAKLKQDSAAAVSSALPTVPATAKGASWGRRRTCLPSRRKARRSITARTSSRSGSFSTRWRPAGARSGEKRRPPFSLRSSKTHLSMLGDGRRRAVATSPPSIL